MSVTKTSKALRVLIVEDDPLIQLGLEQSLSQQPHVTLIGIAEDGYIGVKMAPDDIEIIAALSSGADAYCVKGTSTESLLAAFSVAKDGATYLDPQIARKVMDHLKPPIQIDNTSHLSQRELEVLKLIVEGKSNPEIAKLLYLSPNTIKTHVRSIMNKLSVDDRVQAAVIALRSGLVN